MGRKKWNLAGYYPIHAGKKLIQVGDYPIQTGKKLIQAADYLIPTGRLSYTDGKKVNTGG